ncbi:serine/threonine-protein kinase [Gordonia sp. (in: high G+C Gram-positive bacteria)]|uniref:serine/threonine-protein kinase n=1 Tax=Gordonia sp. (in: high G+C Gram-positive bacteria) TaxID=84139 RepID=UPI00333FFCA0
MGVEAGDVIAGYRVVRTLGAGTMGEVLLVENDRLRRREALKVIASQRADPMLVLRFTNEARLVGSLDHPSIVTVYDFGVEDGVPWFTMPYLDTIDLQARSPLAVDRAFRILSDAAAALDYAHGRGVIHRDIKPANIAVVEADDGTIARVALLDFGVGRLLGATRATADGQLVGSLAYTAPEVLIDGDSGPRSDQYSLACTAFELLTGSLAFAGDSVGEVVHRHTAGAVPVPSDVDPRLARFDEALSRALAKDPAERFATCTDFVRELDSGHDASSMLRTADRSPTPRRSKVRVGRRVIAAGAVVVAVAAGVGGYLAGSNSDPIDGADNSAATADKPATSGVGGDTGGRPVIHRADEYVRDGYRFAFRTEDGAFACYFVDEPMCFPRTDPDHEVAWSLVQRCSTADRGTPTHLTFRHGQRKACAAGDVTGGPTPAFRAGRWDPTPRILEPTHSVFVDAKDGRWVCGADVPGGGPQDDADSDAIMSFSPVWCSRESTTEGSSPAASFGFDREDNGLIVPVTSDSS